MHVAAPSSVGGLETVLHTLATGLAGLGNDIGVLAVLEPPADGHPFIASLQETRVDVMLLEVPRRAYLSEMWHGAAMIQSYRPDVIHTHGSRADLLHFPAARWTRTPIVTTLHGSSQPGGLAGVSERVQSRLLGQFDAVIGVSQALVRELENRGIPASRIHHIPNGSPILPRRFTRQEARRRLGLGKDERVIGWVGRMIPVKGADLFLNALGHFQAEDWKAVVIGDGPELSRLKQMAVSLGLEQRVQFTGEIAAAGTYQAAFDAFVLSSRSEGLPMVLLEAIEARTPIVAFPVGGVGDLLTDMEAFLAVPTNAVDLARALNQALIDPRESQCRAAAAAKRLQSRFSTALWLERHQTLYAALARRSS